MTQSLVVGARQNGDIQHAPPLMRLQVWYYTDLGKNSEVNRDLAQSFSQAELDGWIIRPAKSTPSAGSSRDKYVPIEVSQKPLSLNPAGPAPARPPWNLPMPVKSELLPSRHIV